MVWMLFFQLTPFPSLHHKKLLSVFTRNFTSMAYRNLTYKYVTLKSNSIYTGDGFGWWHTWLGRFSYKFRYTLPHWDGTWFRRWHFQNFQLSLILNMKNLQRSNTNMFWLHWHHEVRWTSAKHHFLPHYIMHTPICLLQKWWNSSCSIFSSVMLFTTTGIRFCNSKLHVSIDRICAKIAFCTAKFSFFLRKHILQLPFELEISMKGQFSVWNDFLTMNSSLIYEEKSWNMAVEQWTCSMSLLCFIANHKKKIAL